MTMLKMRRTEIFTRSFAHLFATSPSPHFRSSPALSPSIWDGTDPRSGGLRGRHGVRQLLQRLRAGGGQ